MSLRLQMLQVARLAPSVLGDASELIIHFLKSQMNPDGGFKNRAGASDLYYTVFGVDAMVAMHHPVPAEPLAGYLRSFGDGGSLDFVHLACLARGWASLPAEMLSPTVRAAMLERIETFRSADGGYDATSGASYGTLYGCFLALGVYQDLHGTMPTPERMAGCIASLRTKDGGYANQREMPVGLTPSTAAAATLLRQLEQPVPPELGPWLLSRCRPDGGFFATPEAPIPDLLSTATAIHALAAMHVELGALKEPCLDFLDSLWTNTGGFYGTWEEEILDCEYTYYGLLALGHLSL